MFIPLMRLSIKCPCPCCSKSAWGGCGVRRFNNFQSLVLEECQEYSLAANRWLDHQHLYVSCTFIVYLVWHAYCAVRNSAFMRDKCKELTLHVYDKCTCPAALFFYYSTIPSIVSFGPPYTCLLSCYLVITHFVSMISLILWRVLVTVGSRYFYNVQITR
jgi:hypothetical protein